MNTPTAHTQRRQPAHHPARTQRPRADLPTAGARLLMPATAGHDFLVPNPRPDLTLDLNLLRMLEAG